MKRNLFWVLFGAIISFQVLFCVMDVSALTVSTLGGTFYLSGGQETLYNNWIKSAAGNNLSHIDSVQWAAATAAESNNSINACSLWIASLGSPSATPEIVINNDSITADGKFNVGIYGMCTKNGINQAVDVEILNNTDGGSFDMSGARVVQRGVWPNPGSGAVATVDKAKFIDGAEVTQDSSGRTAYARTIDIKRCHAQSDGVTSNGSCSHQNVRIVIIMDNVLLAQSNVGNGSDWATTGITSSYKEANLPSRVVRTGDTAPVIFSHNIYSLVNAKDVQWEVLRTGFDSSNFTVSGDSTASSTGIQYVNLDTLYGQYYSAGNRTETDGTYLYLHRDAYNITFKVAGTYTFCEMMNVNGTKMTKVCSTIVVQDNTISGMCSLWTPSNYNSGWTSVLSKINNTMLSGTYSGWQGTVNGNGITYAMPTDPIFWTNCYYPGAQANASKSVTTINGTWVGSEQSHSGCSSKYGTYVTFHQQSVPSKWTNEYKVTTTSPYGFNLPDFSMQISNPFKNVVDFTGSNALSNGDTGIKTVENNYNTVAKDVGKKYPDEISTTGTPIYTSVSSGVAHASWTRCCGSGCGPKGESCCTRTYYHYINTATRTDGSRQSKTEVWIPYNFINTTSFSLNKLLVYAGEEIRVENPQLITGRKDNSLTERKYATRVDGARAKLIAYVASSDQSGNAGIQGNEPACGNLGDLGSELCSEVGSWSGTLNSSDTNFLSGDSRSMFGGEYNVFDAKAGDYMCFALAVFPATSGADDNLNASGDGQWYVSRQCSIIAKRPTFQIYGGSFYTAGSVNTSNSTKHNVYKAYSYTPFGKGNTTIFGSWVEQSTTVLGTAKLLASGAGTGVADTGAGGGSLEGGSIDYCKNRTTLSLANYAMSGSVLGLLICPNLQATGSAGIASTTVNRKALVDFWATGEKNIGANVSVNLNNSSQYTTIASPTGVSVRYTHSAGDITLSGATIAAGVTHVVRADGDVRIEGDLNYNATASLSSAGQIPKLVIYANNITIGCYVNEVDAILIAEGNINTCPDGDINARSRSNQLNVRGMIIADSLELNRTYGTASGTYSGTPAEAINYDTSAILWGRYMAGSAESDTLTVTYQHELAPRY